MAASTHAVTLLQWTFDALLGLVLWLANMELFKAIAVLVAFAEALIGAGLTGALFFAALVSYKQAKMESMEARKT